MAFENIGIGGVLDFESKRAVTNMGTAERAFGSLGRAADSARAGISKVGTGLQGALGWMSTLGVGVLAGVGVAVHKFVSDGMQFNNEMEGAGLAIATIMSTVKKTNLEDELRVVPETMLQLNKVAAEAPGELTDIVGIFQQMAGPMAAGQASMEEMLFATKGTAILAGLLKRSFNDTGAALSKLTAGQYEAGNDILMMLKSMGLIKETTQEWKALLPEQRVKRIGEILKTFEASGARVGQTWEAQKGTFTSMIKMLGGAFTKPLFENMKTSVASINEAFMKNTKGYLEAFERAGRKLGAIIGFIDRNVREFVADTAAGIRKVISLFDMLGLRVDGGAMKSIGGIAVKITAAVIAISPLLTIIGFVGSKIAAIATLAQGLFMVISAIAAPLLIIAGIATGLFMILRHEGESFTDTIMRFWDYIRTLGAELWAPIADSLPDILLAFEQLKVAGAKLWAGVQPGLEAFRSVLDQVVGLVVTLWEGIAPILATIFAGAVRVFEALRPGIEAIFNGVMKVANAVMLGINYIVPKLMPIIHALVEGVMFLGEKAGMLFSKIANALSPLLSAIEYIFLKILWPILGFLIDVFGPVFIAAWKVVVWVVGKLVDALGWVIDAIGWLIGAVGGALKWAFEGIVTIIQWIGDKIMWLVGKITWVYDKTVGLLKSLNQMLTDTEGIDEIVTGNQKAMEMLKPEVKNTAEIAKAVTGTAEIKASKPDVNVNVDIKNNATMCVNGRNLAVAQSAYETEVAERSGFNKTPWQTQRVQIQGVKP